MKKNKSFTLMELLIAVSIFAIIALTLYSTFSGGMRIWQRQEKAFKYSHGVRLALDSMAKELRGAINYSQPEKGQVLGELDGTGLKFIGAERSLSFITLLGGKIAKIGYRFETAPDKKGVLKRYIVFQDEGFKEENQKEKDLIEGLEGLLFEYAYKGQEEDSEPVWQKTWGSQIETEGTATIPIGVRITLEFRQLPASPGQAVNEIIKKTVFIPRGALEEYKGS